MSNRTVFLIWLCMVIGVIVIADSFSPRTLAQKVTDAELIVRGVATLDGLPLAQTEHPVERSCSIAVLETLRPTNEPATNTIVVRRGAWTRWPNTWWNYNSQTGVYFFMRTITALKELRERMKKFDRSGGLVKVDDTFLGTNTWMPLDRFDDWYEPSTNLTVIQQLIGKSKN